MCSICASAVRRMVPKAMLVVDLFHVVQLAVKMTGDVRRRVACAKYGRRGRSGDPEYSVKRLLGVTWRTCPARSSPRSSRHWNGTGAAPAAGRSDRTGRLTAIAPAGFGRHVAADYRRYVAVLVCSTFTARYRVGPPPPRRRAIPVTASPPPRRARAV